MPSSTTLLRARDQALAVERTRAWAARDQRVVDDGDERARDLLPFPIDQVARLAPDRAAVDAAREQAEDRAPRVGIEDHSDFLRVDLARAELLQRAARGLDADRLGVLELIREAARAPVVAAALLAVGVVGDRVHADRGVGAAHAAAKAAARDERRRAGLTARRSRLRCW